MAHPSNPYGFSKRRVSAEVTYAGALPTPSPSSSSGSNAAYQLNRVRRTEGSSESEASSAIGDSEVYNEDFRTGGPHLVRLPAFNHHLTQNDPLLVAWEDKLDAPVRTILKNYNVDIIGVGPLRRSSTSSTEKYDTALVTARKHVVTSDSWFRACKEMLQLFRSQWFMQLNVEIIDTRANPQLISYPVSVSDPFVDSWRVLRPVVLEILANSDWTLLCVVRRRGVNQPEGPITVALTVTEESVNDWTAVRDAIVKLLDSRGHYNVAVEICRSNIWHASSFDDPVLSRRDWDVRAKPGGSLDPRGSTSSASTFGGFIDLQNPISGQWKRFGMTNFYCVIAGSESHPSYERWINEGIKPGDSNNLQLDHPALQDHESSLRYYRKEVDEVRRDVPDSLRQRILSGDPSVSRSQRIVYERQQATLSEIGETLRIATSFDQQKRYLGSVSAASGFKVNKKRQLLDWALVDVDKHRITVNEIPPDGTVSSKYRVYTPPQPIMTGTSSVDEGDRVFKVGRKTGFTGGTVNGIRLSDLQGWVINAQGQREYVQGTATVILPWKCDTFGDPEDSGSFVMNNEAKFIGLYVGGDRDRNIGLVIETQGLFEDIKEVTKCRDVRI
ncbi:hypothetical protein H103_01209 [Trichophyton rubrum CBS 288.86]|uniref:Uncharacterized protein n=1 Tax=Trichophyton rubrum CBS 288.86 TaxID=1215330 RepID=A0A022WD70_TRIRU|nr:hypothetical protein H100_01205 [Trichophyton rubrum MR850]EZF56345.1 hypothetical protein H103_01209 [Trichophyton rubrum CBS 288.86]